MQIQPARRLVSPATNSDEQHRIAVDLHESRQVLEDVAQAGRLPLADGKDKCAGDRDPVRMILFGPRDHIGILGDGRGVGPPPLAVRAMEGRPALRRAPCGRRIESLSRGISAVLLDLLAVDHIVE